MTATAFPWPKCRNNHDLTDPANVTVYSNGRRQCLICKRQQQAPAVRQPRGRPSKHEQMLRWAKPIWAAMNDHDRALIRAWATTSRNVRP